MPKYTQKKNVYRKTKISKRKSIKRKKHIKKSLKKRGNHVQSKKQVSKQKGGGFKFWKKKTSMSPQELAKKLERGKPYITKYSIPGANGKPKGNGKYLTLGNASHIIRSNDAKSYYPMAASIYDSKGRQVEGVQYAPPSPSPTYLNYPTDAKEFNFSQVAMKERRKLLELWEKQDAFRNSVKNSKNSKGIGELEMLNALLKEQKNHNAIMRRYASKYGNIGNYYKNNKGKPVFKYEGASRGPLRVGHRVPPGHMTLPAFNLSSVNINNYDEDWTRFPPGRSNV